MMGDKKADCRPCFRAFAKGVRPQLHNIPYSHFAMREGLQEPSAQGFCPLNLRRNGRGVGQSQGFGQVELSQGYPVTHCRDVNMRGV